jgi:hypothetical protein
MEIKMASIQQNGSSTTATSTKNTGGAAINVGSTTTLVDQVTLGKTQDTGFGSTVIDNSWADEAVSAGTFKYDNPKPIAKRLTTTLSGVSNSVLQSGASQPSLVRSIHKLETLRTRRFTTAIRAGLWNIYTGQFANNQSGATQNPTVATDALATDVAATPTQSAPGQIVYMAGAKNPVYGSDANSEYKAKTNW